MPSGAGARSPRHLLALFLGTTFVLLTALGWLGWQSLQQDRRLEAQLVRERLDSTIDLIAAQIRQNLTDTEEQLTRLSVAPAATLDGAASEYAKRLGDDALLVVFDDDEVRAYPSRRLLYYPTLPAAAEPPPGRFAQGETLEQKDRDYRGAIAYYEKLTRSSDDAVRAGALLGLARNQRKAGDNRAALASYTALSNVTGVSIAGWPADLRARHARCQLLQQLGDEAELKDEARKLVRDLHAGRWRLTRSTFFVIASATEQWLQAAAATPSSATASGESNQARDSVALTLAANVESLWERWQRDRSALSTMPGREVSRERSAFWRATPTRLVALVSGPGFLQHHVVAPLNDLLVRQGVGLVLADGEGRTLLRTVNEIDTPPVIRTPSDTRLPWMLGIVSADPEADFARLAARRWLLIGGLGFMALLAIAGSYFSVRAMTREIQAAQLQSEFVAAVSHEFRTPLTSLRQFTDLLADGRVSNDVDRQKYYAVLQRGTRRLTRLVENLLDFGRMEAGFYRFMLEPVRAKDLVERVTAEFEDEVRQRGYRVERQWSGPHDPVINADEAAIGRALWNLLDNAVKYSPDHKTIWVDGAAAQGSVTISVRDRGIGVAEPEQRAIFRKFVRGSLPNGSTIKGTGLGLALVDQIVRAHGGRVKVESRIGEGSTFAIVLPAQKTAVSAHRDIAVAEAQS